MEEHDGSTIDCWHLFLFFKRVYNPLLSGFMLGLWTLFFGLSVHFFTWGYLTFWTQPNFHFYQ